MERDMSVSENKYGSVILVGAGCGRGLITLRGLEELRRADAVVYDDLIDDGLLSEAKSGAELIYVGKRLGKHSMAQDDINRILISCAARHARTVRLKGGDSFVFGRGGEEVLALRDAGVPYALVPGVSSSIAVPETLGIPVTHRKVARSFTVITGHTADGTGESYEALAGLGGTLIFLMGLRSADTIAQSLIRCGKDPATPAAILSNGFSANETRIDATLGTLGEMAKKASTPAILVIGPTAGMHLSATVPGWNSAGRARVLVTGTESFTARLAARLEREELTVDRCVCLRIVPRPERIPEDLSAWGWLAFTSVNGVDLFFEALRKRRIDVRSLAGLHFAVIGKGTALALERHGVLADFVPSAYTSTVFGNELPEAMRRAMSGESNRPEEHSCPEAPENMPRLLILRAANGSPVLAEELRAAGVSFDDIHIYDAEAVDNDAENDTACGQTAQCASSGSANDYIVFASAAGVRAYFSSRALPAGAAVVCIGPSTAEEFEKHSDLPYLMPAEHTVDGVAEVIRHSMVR
ncbi:MAG: uroporphyrinogen-III C-methyltransferase [Eubacteriales bacterium]|jgi:uroporphyrinogen III methyltransferase/synthase